jgi:hypothetical protein
MVGHLAECILRFREAFLPAPLLKNPRRELLSYLLRKFRDPIECCHHWISHDLCLLQSVIFKILRQKPDRVYPTSAATLSRNT